MKKDATKKVATKKDATKKDAMHKTHTTLRNADLTYIKLHLASTTTTLQFNILILEGDIQQVRLENWEYTSYQ